MKLDNIELPYMLTIKVITPGRQVFPVNADHRCGDISGQPGLCRAWSAVKSSLSLRELEAMFTSSALIKQVCSVPSCPILPKHMDTDMPG